MLLELGAVLYVKTNIPQTMMVSLTDRTSQSTSPPKMSIRNNKSTQTADSENNIFGRTLNPHNTSLTAGGSSGGEGALVAFRGSILGVGTDVAGSIRIPSLCCGVYGFKPTTARVPFGGQFSGIMEGLPGLIPSAGPLAHSVTDLRLFMETVVGTGNAWEYDHTAAAVPWNKTATVGGERNGSLTIGVLSEDKHFPLHPPVKRALDRAVEALTKAGHRIVRIENDTNEDLSVAYASRLAFQYFNYGPHVDLIGPSGEPLVASVARFSSPMFTGPWPVEQEQDPLHKVHELHTALGKVSDAWRREWVEKKLDVILAPGSQSTAVGFDTYGWPPYTVMWNLLDVSFWIVFDFVFLWRRLTWLVVSRLHRSLWKGIQGVGP